MFCGVWFCLIQASRNAEDTGNWTLALLLAITFVPRWFVGWGVSVIGWISPRTAFLAISEPGFRIEAINFIGSVITTNLAALGSLLLAAYFLPKRWEESRIIETSAKTKRRNQIPPEEKRRILSRNPGEWIALRYKIARLQSIILNSVIFLLCLVAFFNDTGPNQSSKFVTPYLALLLMMIRLASQASYPLAEARRSGAVEMILSTPLNPWLLVRGQISALWKQFRIGIGILFTTAILLFLVSWDNYAWQYQLFFAGYFIFALAAGTCGIAATGMWLGLREKTANAAFFKSMVYAFGPVVLFCLAFALPVWWAILFLHAVSKISGTNFRRLLNPDQEMKSPPVIAAAKA